MVRTTHYENGDWESISYVKFAMVKYIVIKYLKNMQSMMTNYKTQCYGLTFCHVITSDFWWAISENRNCLLLLVHHQNFYWCSLVVSSWCITRLPRTNCIHVDLLVSLLTGKLYIYIIKIYNYFHWFCKSLFI